jgi:predicted transcriptional regulator
MSDKQKRTTIYLDAETHRALKMKALVMEQSVSYLVNDAVKRLLAEDAEDLAAFDERAGESGLDFEDVVKDLKRRGKI